MARSYTIDNLKGIAFLLMLIYHICSVWDLTTGITEYKKIPVIDYMGIIARTLFILLAGYSINSSYKKHKESFFSERIKRSFTILGHALIMTILTYILYPDKYIRFGILHFIFLATLVSPLLAPYKNITLIIFIISILIDYPRVNSTRDTITGAYIHNSMIDWFPLNKNIPIILYSKKQNKK